jgi:hypothetical protein
VQTSRRDCTDELHGIPQEAFQVFSQQPTNMAKKTTTPKTVENVPLRKLEVNIPKISEVTTDFGRADLNELRDKINELIRSK